MKRRATFTDCKAARHTAVRRCGAHARAQPPAELAWLGEARGRTSCLVAAGCGCNLQAGAARSQRGTRQEAGLGLCGLAAGIRAALHQTKARQCPRAPAPVLAGSSMSTPGRHMPPCALPSTPSKAARPPAALCRGSSAGARRRAWRPPNPLRLDLPSASPRACEHTQ